jgi:hypothetical protein
MADLAWFENLTQRIRGRPATTASPTAEQQSYGWSTPSLPRFHGIFT